MTDWTDWVDYIEQIRTKNNVLWMDILRLAMLKAPEETKRILRDIRDNDRKISEATRRLSNDEN
jgi:hypothetical protein